MHHISSPLTSSSLQVVLMPPEPLTILTTNKKCDSMSEKSARQPRMFLLCQKFFRYTSFPSEICESKLPHHDGSVVTVDVPHTLQCWISLGLNWIMVSNLPAILRCQRGQPVGKQQFLARLVVTVACVTFFKVCLTI